MSALMTEAGAPLRFDRRRRSSQPEWLDGENVSEAELRPYLRALTAFNRATCGLRPIIGWLDRATARLPPGPVLTLLDVGCGDGELLRVLTRWARRRRRAVRFIGVDRNPRIVRLARAATGAAEPIDFVTADVFDYRPAARIDFVTASLVTHHLPDPRIVELLNWMERTAARGWINCDLQRHVVARLLIGAAGRLGALHPRVAQDGRISVARALTRAEWEQRIAESAVPRRALRLRWFLFRLVVSRLREEADLTPA